MKELTEDDIRKLRKLREDLIKTYDKRDEMLRQYEQIYFMENEEVPRQIAGTDEKDVKVTISSSGRDAVIGMKRILDSGRVHVEITGEGGDKDKCESALKTMLQVSGQNRIASVEKELNLSAILYGPSVAGVDAVDDLIAAQEGNPWTQAHLKRLKKQTPFLIYPVRPDESYPMFGAWGMIGHVRKYKLRGSELIERWGMYADCDPNKTYEVKDFFYFHQRLVEAEGIKDPLLAVEWLSQDENGEFISSLAIPIFTRFAGGSGMYENPERQSQPLLYAKAKGGWHLRENLFWTYLFTGIYNQGLPGPVAIVKPDSADQTIQVSYQNGMKTIVMDGVLDNPPVIDGDVMQIHGMMEQVAATQTVQPQTLGMNSNGVTFSQFAMASKAGMIPAIDPKEAQEQLYTDIFRHILERIKAESIENELLAPGDIPDGFAITVKIEPDLEQDDLRNAQIALQIKQAGLASGEWIDTNLLKIPDSKKMWRQRKMEEMRDAIVELMKDPQFLSQYLPKKKAAPAQNNPGALPGAVPGAGGEMPGEMPGAVPGAGGEMPGEMPGAVPGGEQLPQTDAMIPGQERM